jgi:hypothetical protein
MGEYFEILAARVDPGRIRKRQRNDDGKTDPRRVRTLEDNRDAVRSTLTQALARALANLFWRQSEPPVPAYSPISNGEEPSWFLADRCG